MQDLKGKNVNTKHENGVILLSPLVPSREFWLFGNCRDENKHIDIRTYITYILHSKQAAVVRSIKLIQSAISINFGHNSVISVNETLVIQSIRTFHAKKHTR